MYEKSLRISNLIFAVVKGAVLGGFKALRVCVSIQEFEVAVLMCIHNNIEALIKDPFNYTYNSIGNY